MRHGDLGAALSRAAVLSAIARGAGRRPTGVLSITVARRAAMSESTVSAGTPESAVEMAQWHVEDETGRADNGTTHDRQRARGAEGRSGIEEPRRDRRHANRDDRDLRLRETRCSPDPSSR